MMPRARFRLFLALLTGAFAGMTSIAPNTSPLRDLLESTAAVGLEVTQFTRASGST